MSWVRVAVAVALCGVVVPDVVRSQTVLVPPVQRLSPPRPSRTMEATRALLQRFSDGDYDTFRHLLPGSPYPDPRSMLADLKDLVSPWLKSGGGSPARARRVLAAFALELGSMTLVDRTSDAAAVLAWARERLIMPHAQPDAFDKHWHHVVIAIFENLGAADAVSEELDAALKQFPAEPRFVLARAWVEEEKLAQDLQMERALPDDKLRRVFARLNEAVALPDVRAEALVRLGRVEMATRRFDDALTHLEEARSAIHERTLRYWLELFRGRSLAKLGRAQEADAAYQAALALVPGAQSATMALADLWFLQGARSRAEALVDDLMRREIAADDPWWIYRRGDARMSADLTSALRGELE